MERLNRKIGYIKPELRNNSEDTAEKTEAKNDTKSVLDIITPLLHEATISEVKIQAILSHEKTAAKKIVLWLKEHPEFKWSALCKDTKIDKGNFQRILKAKEPNIKLEHIIIIEDILKKYGYGS